MTDTHSHESSAAPGGTPGAEIALLISNILEQGSATFDPAKELLGKLNNEVEQNARKNANDEIGQMLKQMEARKIEAIKIPQLPDHAPSVSFPEEIHIAPPEPIEFDPLIEGTEVEETEIAAPLVAAAAGGNDWFGHNPDGLPLWMTAGIPVAAVSAFALGLSLMDRDAAADITNFTNEVVAVETVSAVHTRGDADSLRVDLFQVSADQDKIAPIEAIYEASSVEALLASPESSVTATQALATDANIAPVTANYIVREKIDPPRVEEVAPTPSEKPDVPAITAPEQVARSVVAPQPQPQQQKRPIGSVPKRIYSGSMPAGSAAQIVNAVARQAGSDLTRPEQIWLASDMERALENEIDGRSVSLRAKDGQRLLLAFSRSEQVQREFGFARAKEISSLPHDIVVAGGWYTARNDVMLHATPALNSGLVHRVVEKDQFIERLGTFTDRYGAQWYLMGQRGLAVGFVSPADLAVAGSQQKQLGSVYSDISGEIVFETRRVYTTCRTGYINALGELKQPTRFCRNVAGNWVAHRDGQELSQIASFTGALNPAAGRANTIVVAQGLGDPVAYSVFANQKVRRRIQADLVNARFGQTSEHVLPDGDPLQLVFGETFTTERKVPVKSVEGLSKVSGKLKVDAEWAKVPIGATLRAAPDYLSQQGLTEIPAGTVVEKMGYVEGTRGDDWVLVGRSGVGFGYVNPEKLAPLQGREVAVQAIKNERARAEVDLVEVTTMCRAVGYKTSLRVGNFIACQQTDGSWTLREPQAPETNSFAQAPTAAANAAP